MWWRYQLDGGRKTGLLENGRRESERSESGDVHDQGERSGDSLFLWTCSVIQSPVGSRVTHSVSSFLFLFA